MPNITTLLLLHYTKVNI